MRHMTSVPLSGAAKRTLLPQGHEHRRLDAGGALNRCGEPVELADTRPCACTAFSVILRPRRADRGAVSAMGVRRHLGREIGGYRVHELIGEGAMGCVFRARKRASELEVAVKVLRDELAEIPSFRQRFLAEIRAAQLVGGKEIVEVLDVGVEPDGITWFAMELLDGGQDLRALASHGPMPALQGLRLTRLVCEALAALHRVGVVHLDLKPDHVFVTNRGGAEYARLLDMGIAHVPGFEGCASNDALGTPPYMAPEQILREPVGPSTDLYAVGALLFELLTGRLVFQTGSLSSMLAAALYQQPPRVSDHVSLPPVVRARVDELVLGCLDKQARNRPQSASALAGQLRGLERHLQQQASDSRRPPIPAGQGGFGTPAHANSGSSRVLMRYASQSPAHSAASTARCRVGAPEEKSARLFDSGPGVA